MIASDPDRNLVERIQGSGSRARAKLFEQIHERHHERIFALCLRRTRNQEDALDAVQETFITAASQIDGFRREARFSTWLHRIALNKCGEISRRRRRRQRLEEPVSLVLGSESPYSRLADDGPLPVDQASDAERDGRVRRAVDALPTWLRAAVYLRYFEHLPYEEIAAALEVPVGTVKSRLFRAHRTLERELGPLTLCA